MTFATDIFDGDGSETEFELTFDYIERDHVKVYRVAEDETETELTVVTDGSALGDDDYKWETDKKVKLGKAPASTEKCKVVRETPEDRQLVQWKDGSYIVAEDLNTSDKQFLYIDQEHDDRIETLEGFVPTVEKAAITQSEAEKDPDDPAWSGDERIATVGAIDRIYSNVVGSGSSYPGTGNKGKLGKLRLDNTTTPAKMFWWDASLATPAWVELKVEGKKGDPGDPGAAATVEVDSTVTLDPGNDAKVTNTGTSSAAKFKFEIPKGEKGDPGKDGTGAGTVTGVLGGPGINSDGSSATPTLSVDLATNPGLETTPAGTGGKLQVKAHTGITVDANGVSVTTPFSEPTGDDGNYLRKKDGTTFSWEKDSGGSGTVTEVKAGDGITVADGTTTPTVTAKSGANSITVDGDGIKVKVKSGGGITVDAYGLSASSSGVPDVTTDGSFNRTQSGGTKSWTTAAPSDAQKNVQSDWNQTTNTADDFIKNKPVIPAASPWTRAEGTPNVVSPATAADTVSTAGGPLLTAQVRDSVQELSADGAATPNFATSNVIRLSGTGMTINAPDNPGVGQSGIFYIHGTATVTGWNSVYKWPAGTALTSKTGYTIIPFYVFDATTIRMGAATEDIK